MINCIERCLGFLPVFDKFFNKHKDIITKNLTRGKTSFKECVNDGFLLCEFFGETESNTLFLLSEYNKNRTILKQSFRFDYSKETGELVVIDWHIEGCDFVTIKHVFATEKQIML